MLSTLAWVNEWRGGPTASRQSEGACLRPSSGSHCCPPGLLPALSHCPQHLVALADFRPFSRKSFTHCLSQPPTHKHTHNRTHPLTHPQTHHPHSRQVILRKLSLELMRKLDDELKHSTAEDAAFYEHRLQVGRPRCSSTRACAAGPGSTEWAGSEGCPGSAACAAFAAAHTVQDSLALPASLLLAAAAGCCCCCSCCC